MILLSYNGKYTLTILEGLKRIDIMKAISSPNWRALSKILRTFYIAYIRSKIDYGTVLYDTTAKSNLDKLERIQHACVRLILAARKSTPIVSLQAEAHVPPLEIRRGYLSVKALIKFSNMSKCKSALNIEISSKNYSNND